MSTIEIIDDCENCQICGKTAEIWQVTGSWCVSCYQKETHPRV